MNDNTQNKTGQGHREHFDPTDKGLRSAWSCLLVRYPWDCFATLTFNRPRRDPFEIVNAFNIWLNKWHEQEAVDQGLHQVKHIPRTDAYGRELRPRLKRSGSWWNAWKKGRGRPVYCLGIEEHESGLLHMHAVIKFQTPWQMTRTNGWRMWSDMDYPAGMKMGWSRLEPPKSLGDVAGYVSKYVTKGGEIVLSPSFTAKRVQVPSSPEHAHTAS